MYAEKRSTGLERLKRMLLVQVLPFALMLIISGWLSLWAGRQIEQFREQRLTASQVHLDLRHF